MQSSAPPPALAPELHIERLQMGLPHVVCTWGGEEAKECSKSFVCNFSSVVIIWNIDHLYVLFALVLLFCLIFIYN